MRFAKDGYAIPGPPYAQPRPRVQPPVYVRRDALYGGGMPSPPVTYKYPQDLDLYKYPQDLVAVFSSEILRRVTDDALFAHYTRLEYAVRVCLERWVSGAEPCLIYQCGKFVGLGVEGGNGAIVVHAPPTDRFYLATGTGYPPDWDFYGARV